MKNTWQLLDEHERSDLKLFQFPSKLISTMKQNLSKEQLVHGWGNSCVFPFDRETIKKPTVKKETNIKPLKLDVDNAFIAMSSLLSFLPRSKIENFEATLKGKAKLEKSDETIFGYFCHLKQVLVDSQVSSILSSMEKTSSLESSSVKIKIEPDLVNENNFVAVKMEPEEHFEDFVKVENILS